LNYSALRFHYGAGATTERIVMLRKLAIGCAVVVAMLAVPALSAHSMGGVGGHSFGGMHGGMHSMGGMHSFGSPHNFGMASRFGGVHTFHHRAFFSRRHFAHFDHFRHFARFHHFRHHFPIFATAIGVGYSNCWQWVPTRWGWHRVWVC
jgi:hypothetical protein